MYADIIMQLEYVRVAGQPSMADKKVSQNAQQSSSAAKRVITPEQLEMSQIDLDETSGEQLKSPGGGYQEQLGHATEESLAV